MFSRFSRRMFHARGNNEGSPSRGGSTSSHAPSAKKPCNRPGSESDDIQKRKSKSQSCEVDNSDKLVAKIAALYAERLMSDVTLVINGVDFPAHRLILCASSDVFQVMLMNPHWSESQKSTVVLQESVECAQSFEDFLKYLYTGSLKLQLANVMHLLTLADKYNVKDLINLCLNYMITHVPAAGNQNQLIQWYQYTANCGHDAVASKCRDFIKWNFDMMSKTEDFHHLDLELLTSILLDDDVVIYDERALFTCVEQWVMCQRSKLQQNGESDLEEKMLTIVQEILACIRFPMMSPRQLADLLLCPLTQQYKEYLMEKMAIAMHYHVSSTSNNGSGIGDPLILDLVESHPNKSKFFMPRLYMTDQWSICMTVDNFSEMIHFQSKTLVFSTPISFAERACERQVEWVVDFYPKGVCFFKHYLIVWQGTVEVPEHVMQTVRLSVSCKNEEESDVRVQIGILIAGSLDGVDHIHKCVRRNYIFTKNDRVLNFDDLLPYGELIQCANCNLQRDNASGSLPRMPPTSNLNRNPSTSSTTDPRNPYCSLCTVCGSGKSCYLIGENHDSLKIKVSICAL